MFKKYIVSIENNNMALADYLKERLGISARNRQKFLNNGSVKVNGKKGFSKRLLKTGDVVEVKEQSDVDYGVIPENGKIEVLFEDDFLIAINKPAGILVHPSGMTNNGTLANYLAGYYQEKKKIITVRPIHRLDRDTSGIVIFAKNAEVQKNMTELFTEENLHRTYFTIVKGELKQEAATINLPIGKDRNRPNRRIISKDDNGQKAVTHYQVKKVFSAQGEKYSFLEVNLETGRTHQIRVHLAAIGYPVLGDGMYGKRSRLIKRQALHAAKIEFIHPVTAKTIKIGADLPTDFTFC